MVLPEVDFERVVVDVVLLLPVVVTTVADVTTLVLVTTVSIQLVVSIEALSTEAALRMSFEAALVNGARIIVTEFLVLLQVGPCEKLVLVCEDFLVSCTEVAVNH